MTRSYLHRPPTRVGFGSGHSTPRSPKNPTIHDDQSPATALEEDYERALKESTSGGATSRAAHQVALGAIMINAYKVGRADERREMKHPVRHALARCFYRIADVVRP